MTKHNEPHDENADEAVDIDQATEVSKEELQKSLAAAQAALTEANDRALRFKAEAENARRRAVVDVENAHKYGIEKK